MTRAPKTNGADADTPPVLSDFDDVYFTPEAYAARERWRHKFPRIWANHIANNPKVRAARLVRIRAAVVSKWLQDRRKARKIKAEAGV
jgi:hypothetical protein